MLVPASQALQVGTRTHVGKSFHRPRWAVLDAHEMRIEALSCFSY
jgi:hypothetical protein